MTISTISERAKKAHKEAIVIDMLMGLGEGESRKRYLTEMISAGITAVSTTVSLPGEDIANTISQIARFHNQIEYLDNALIAHSVADIEKAKEEGKAAGIIGLQSPETYEKNIDLLKVFHILGCRVMQVAYDYQNYLGSGCAEPVDHGLTDRGKRAVQEMNRLGMLIDTAHCGDNTTIDIAKASKYPIAISHATPGALIDIPRGKSDKAIKAVAERGGVYGQVYLAAYCAKKDKKGVRPTVSDWADLIDYLVNLAGIDHIGIGSDLVPFWTKADYERYWGVYGKILLPNQEVPPFEEKYTQGLESVGDIINITEELLRRGYSDDETKKLLGGNWLRLLKEVWK